METFSRLIGIAAPLPEANIDTGMLAPAQWARDNPNDLGGGLFREWRFDAEGTAVPGFVLNQPRYRNARILVAGPNFGCGSSRETAVWALMRYGFRCVIAPSFGEIFEDNCYQNGLLPVRLPRDQVDRLIATIDALEDPTLCVDLIEQRIEIPGAEAVGFTIAPDRRIALLEGLDETLVIRAAEPDIAAFEARDRRLRPWVYERRAASSR